MDGALCKAAAELHPAHLSLWNWIKKLPIQASLISAHYCLNIDLFSNIQKAQQNINGDGPPQAGRATGGLGRLKVGKGPFGGWISSYECQFSKRHHNGILAQWADSRRLEFTWLRKHVQISVCGCMCAVFFLVDYHVGWPECGGVVLPSAWRWGSRRPARGPCGRSWWWGTGEGSTSSTASRQPSSTRGCPTSHLNIWYGCRLLLICK